MLLRSITALMFTSLVVALTSAPSLAQDKDSTASGRLPAYYKEVVDEKQKTQIYQIQSQHDAKLATLEKQYDTLLEQVKKLRTDIDSIRDEERAAIEKVLTPQQFATVKKMQAEAQSRLAQELLKAAEEAARRAEQLSQPE